TVSDLIAFNERYRTNWQLSSVKSPDAVRNRKEMQEGPYAPLLKDEAEAAERLNVAAQALSTVPFTQNNRNFLMEALDDYRVAMADLIELNKQFADIAYRRIQARDKFFRFVN